MTSISVPTKAKWELVLPVLKVLSKSLQLVCESGDAVGCLLLRGLRPFSFDLFFNKIRFFQPSILLVKDCKHELLGVFPIRCSFSGLLDLVVRSE
jgi:hypothetical protein